MKKSSKFCSRGSGRCGHESSAVEDRKGLVLRMTEVNPIQTRRDSRTCRREGGRSCHIGLPAPGEDPFDLLPKV